ncbi:hypothetical protein KY328_01440 [Candidatus Woesearchaeota archaeon]|nr:hypothetical protein [Candidatus Woesearchaeota archaeon]MBW3021560.1 hypothetical protein [Candidatus Woesearchaeota archaeon]
MKIDFKNIERKVYRSHSRTMKLDSKAFLLRIIMWTVLIIGLVAVAVNTTVNTYPSNKLIIIMAYSIAGLFCLKAGWHLYWNIKRYRQLKDKIKRYTKTS